MMISLKLSSKVTSFIEISVILQAVITCLSTSILVPNGTHRNYLLTYQPPPPDCRKTSNAGLMSFPLDNPTLGTEFNQQKRFVCLEALPRRLGGHLEREEGNRGKSSCLLFLQVIISIYSSVRSLHSSPSGLSCRQKCSFLRILPLHRT